MKYDVVIGNPPYQSPVKGALPLWPKFINTSLTSLKDGGYLAYITPDKWIEPIGSPLLNVYETIRNKNLITFKDADNHFKVSESISYFILTKEEYKGFTYTQDWNGHFDRRPRDLKYHIWDKVKWKNKRMKDGFAYFRIDQADKLFKSHKQGEYTIKVYQGSKVSWAKPSDCKDIHNHFKVMMNASGAYRIFIDDEPSLGNKHTRNVLCKDKRHQDKMYKWLNHPIHHFCIEALRSSGFISSIVVNFEAPTEQMLEMNPYTYYNLTKEEIEYIKNETN